MDENIKQPVDPRLIELSQTFDTIQYIKGVLNENVIHGEEAIKTVGALQWLDNLGNAIHQQAQVYMAQPQPQMEDTRNG